MAVPDKDDEWGVRSDVSMCLYEVNSFCRKVVGHENYVTEKIDHCSRRHAVVCWCGRCSRSRKACLVGTCQACVDETYRACLAASHKTRTAFPASASSRPLSSATSRAASTPLHRYAPGGATARATASWRAAIAATGAFDDSLRFTTGCTGALDLPAADA